MIEIKKLSKKFESKDKTVNALVNIDLKVEQSDIFGIIGLSGAGKSTLVRCINFLEKPTTGNVIIDGKDLKKLSYKQLLKERQSIGMIFQGFNLLMQKNVVENIAFPLLISGIKKDKAIERANELLKIVDLEDKEKAYPAELSGGQKQRVAIARALATNPKILLCDEATSALDPNTTRSILALLKQINKDFGITIVIITHEMDVIEEVCNKVAIIDKGIIAETGNVEDIFAKPKSDIAKKLIFGENQVSFENISNAIRIIFDGKSSKKSVISDMITKCQCDINIVFAELKNIDGKTLGQMVIGLPSEQENTTKIYNYLIENEIKFEEVS